MQHSLLFITFPEKISSERNPMLVLLVLDDDDVHSTKTSRNDSWILEKQATERWSPVSFMERKTSKSPFG
jgi:hypothetical protein